MRKTCNHGMRNTVQNIVIVCLILSALFLLMQTRLIHTDTLHSFFSTVSPSTAAPVSGEKLSYSFPVRMTVRRDNECYTWLNETTAGEVFEDLGSVLGESLGAAGNLVSVRESEFRHALENDSVFYDFTTSVPLPLLAQRLSIAGSSPRTSIRALLLSGMHDNTLTLYAWDAERDHYYRWNTSLPADTLFAATEKHEGQPAEFAFLCNPPYDALTPYTPVPKERPALREASSVSTVDERTEGALLTRLEFNVHSNARYPESNGAEVIVQGSRTLRFSLDGTVTYSGDAESIPLLTVKHGEEDATLSEVVQSAWYAVSTLLSDGGSNVGLTLHSAEIQEPGSAEVTFGYLLDGYPVIFQNGPAATVQIQDNHIVHFTLHLREYTLTDKTRRLLPVSHAAAAVTKEMPVDLFPGYYDDGEALSPCWLQE